MEVKEVIRVRRYKAGYEVREEVHNGKEYGCKDFTMKVSYTPDGHYIGDSKWGHRLCKIRGIKPELRTEDSRTCSIGFCEKEKKWYGWSHRAIYGFGIGSSVKRGDCAYSATDKDDFLDDMVRFWTDENRLDIKGTHTDEGVATIWTYSEKIGNKKSRGKIGGDTQQYPDEYGRGEWTAETLEDARQMACDFAEGVS